MLIVFPNGIANSHWVDSKDGRLPMETITIKELLPHIDTTFRTIASANGRLIEGVSMGGDGAAHLGFKYPDLFGAVTIISGGLLQQVFDVTAAPRATPAAAQALLDAVFGGDQEYFRVHSPWAPWQSRTSMRSARCVSGKAVTNYYGKMGRLTSSTDAPAPDCYYCLTVKGMGDRADVQHYVRENVGEFLR